jgi:hypothetical protein
MEKAIAEAEERVKQHQPVVIDIQDDGECLKVRFVRRNGEVVSGMYKLWGWGQPPATVMVEMGFVDPAGAAEMAAASRPRARARKRRN